MKHKKAKPPQRNRHHRPPPSRGSMPSQRVLDLAVMKGIFEAFSHEANKLKQEANIFVFCAQDLTGRDYLPKSDGGILPDEVVEMQKWLRRKVIPQIYNLNLHHFFAHTL